MQIDEPELVLDLNPNERVALEFAYGQLSKAAPELKIMLTTYFGPLGDNLETAISLPVAGLHLDLVRAPEQLETVGRLAPKDLVLSLGLIDGRNVWRANLPAILDRIKPIVAGWSLGPSRDRAFVLDAVCADRLAYGDGAGCEHQVVARLRGPEDRRAGHPGPGLVPW